MLQSVIHKFHFILIVLCPTLTISPATSDLLRPWQSERERGRERERERERERGRESGREREREREREGRERER